MLCCKNLFLYLLSRFYAKVNSSITFYIILSRGSVEYLLFCKNILSFAPDLLRNQKSEILLFLKLHWGFYFQELIDRLLGTNVDIVPSWMWELFTGLQHTKATTTLSNYKTFYPFLSSVISHLLFSVDFASQVLLFHCNKCQGEIVSCFFSLA